MPSRFRVAAIGELLWDILPGGSRLGGAPANFAAMAGALGNDAFLISQVGDDELGRKALRELAARPLRLDHVTVDARYPTGTVTVTLDPDAVATYDIHQPAAWDYLPDSPDAAALAASLDAVCFGTLAQRSPVSRETLRRQVERTPPGCIRVFDVNLRAPYWNAESLAWGCARASIVKMNHEEVPLVARVLEISEPDGPLLAVARSLLKKFPLRMVAITRGGHGSLLVAQDGAHDHPGIPTNVVDTIGAGDAFTAALAHYVLRAAPLPVVAEGANRWGSWVASQAGGQPVLREETRDAIFARIAEAVHPQPGPRA